MMMIWMPMLNVDDAHVDADTLERVGLTLLERDDCCCCRILQIVVEDMIAPAIYRNSRAAV